ncbi:MAG: hypothetical protein Kow0090_07940 [Myxococcota bacterium]
MQDIRILIIDDDESICEYLQTLLVKDGYKASAVQDPMKGLELLKRDHFHLLILDLMMPQIDGISLLEQIRQIDLDIAVIVFTGYPSVDTAVKSLKLNVVDYLQKPLGVSEFRSTIKRVLRQRGLLLDPEDVLHRRIGQRIRRKRKDMGLTLKQLSNRTSVSVSMLSMIERAESSASISTLYRVAAALETPIEKFFMEEAMD